MVLEHLFPQSLVERKGWSAFILAFIYSSLAILISRLLFPANSGIVSVIFVSIFLIPYFKGILKREEMQEIKDENYGFLRLLRDNSDAIKTYFFIFFGIYFSYLLYSFLSPLFGYDISSVFREQISLEGLRGGASFSGSTFFSILLNNWWVLLACFLIALIAGDGAIFFVAWNASAWGTIFGYRAIAAAITMEGGFGVALMNLLTIEAITLPHTILEGGAYIIAAIAGGVISDQMDRREEVRSFVVYFIGAAVLYVVLYIFYRTFAMGPIALGTMAIITAFALLYLMHFVFVDKGDQLVFRYNLHLFAFAVGVFVVGAIVETLVLYNADALNRVYLAAAALG